MHRIVDILYLLMVALALLAAMWLWLDASPSG
jgi:hypothetical protein